jgi:hypothetical protein
MLFFVYPVARHGLVGNPGTKYRSPSELETVCENKNKLDQIRVFQELGFLILTTINHYYQLLGCLGFGL